MSTFLILWNIFPSASIKVLPDAGHDVHVEDRAGFLSFFEEFLKSLD